MFWSRVFLPFALGYFISQLFRSVNAVVFSDLVEELGLDAMTIGFLTSAYFLAFAAAQLPVGVALDRFGARRTESALLLVAAAGALVFSAAESAIGLTVGRALIGLGVSACLMAAFHAFALSREAERAGLAFRNGAVMAVGAAGALTATVPVEWALSVTGWRVVFQALAITTVALSAFLYLRVPDETISRRHQSLAEVTRGLGAVFKDKPFWSIAPLSVTHQGAYLSIQSLWAGPWLRDVAGLSRELVAEHLMLVSLAMGVGFIGLGFVADRVARWGISTLSVWVSSALLFQIVQLAILFGWVDAARWLWIGFGLFGAAGMLSYVIITRRFALEMAGRVNSGLNVFVFAGAFAFQAGIGTVIASFQPAEAIGGGFDPSGYPPALGLVLALQVASMVWLALTSSWRR